MSGIGANLSRLNEVRENPTLGLLNLKWSTVILAVFAEAFGEERRQVRTEVFHSQVEVLLEELAELGYDVPDRETRDLCRSWVESRWLRRLPSEDGGELYELTSYALEAQRTINGLAREQVVLSDSRLTTIISKAQELALNAHPDREEKIRILQTEINDRQAQIERLLAGGELAAATDDGMLNGFIDLNDLLSKLPGDFQRVTEGIRQIHREMVQGFHEADLTRGEVLDAYIDQSERLTGQTVEGRAYESALTILNDEKLMGRFKENLRTIIAHPFADTVRPDERREFLDANAMLGRGLDLVVHERHKASRSLRDNLATRDSAQARELGQLLVRIQGELRIWMQDARPRDTVPLDRMPAKLNLDRVVTRFYDPATEKSAPGIDDVTRHAPAVLSLDEVRRWGGPLVAEVREGIASRIEAGTATTIGQAFNQLPDHLRRPVEVFALMQVATNTPGLWNPDSDDFEIVEAIRPDGTTRKMPIPLISPTPTQIHPQEQQ